MTRSIPTQIETDIAAQESSIAWMQRELLHRRTPALEATLAKAEAHLAHLYLTRHNVLVDSDADFDEARVSGIWHGQVIVDTTT